MAQADRIAAWGWLMPRNNDALKARKQSANRISSLVKSYPGIEQRHLPNLVGSCIHYVKELVDEMVAAGMVERRRNDSGVVTLYPVGYSSATRRPTQPVRRPDCYIYRVPKTEVLRYCNPDLPIPIEFQVVEVADE